MPFPDADTLHLVQNWHFGGVPNAPTVDFAGTPFLNFNHTYDFTDSVAKVHDTHTIKGGIYLHKSLKDLTLDVKEGPENRVTLVLDPVPPYLNLTTHQHVYLPGEKAVLNCKGFTRSDSLPPQPLPLHYRRHRLRRPDLDRA